MLLQFTYTIGQILPPIPLPGDIQYVILNNNTGETANFRLLWQLSL